MAASAVGIARNDLGVSCGGRIHGNGGVITGGDSAGLRGAALSADGNRDGASGGVSAPDKACE